MINVAFVCLGNICRSPMAELYFKSLVRSNGRDDDFFVTSFGTSDEEEGNPIYPPAAAMLARHGIYGSHTARQMRAADADDADYILVMDGGNYRRAVSIAGEKNAHKVHKLCDYTSRPRDVADPWYTRDFETAFSDIKDGCDGFLKHIIRDVLKEDRP